MADIPYATETIVPRQVDKERPWRWLAQGWNDMWQRPGISLVYGGVFTVVSGLITAVLLWTGLGYLLPPLAAGFMLVGPMLPLGLYETSRRLGAGQPIGLREALVVSVRSPTQLAFMGALLALALMAWMQIAAFLFALFFGTRLVPPLDESVHLLLFTWSGAGLLVVGTVVGGIIAAAVFTATAVSVPILMVRDIDAVSAMIISIKSVRANLWPMVLWAWLITLLTAAGIATLYVGMIITFPLVGHATWHAYQDLVGEADE